MSSKDQRIAILITTIAASHSSIGGSGLYLEYIPDFTCQQSSLNVIQSVLHNMAGVETCFLKLSEELN